MTDERVVDDIVTNFILNTCRLRRQLTQHAVQAAVLGAWVVLNHLDDYTYIDCIPQITGSSAEFYIEPILPYINDVDIMFYANTQLAIPRGHPPPAQLPAEFYKYVKVYEIMDSHKSGYVYLELRYCLEKCKDSDRYNDIGIEYEEYGLYSSTTKKEQCEFHGPAQLLRGQYEQELSADLVHCARCFSWPPQAADWPTRHRNHGWPDSATVDRVVNNGCDVVQVAHRQCRQDEWMSECQCRLSFSRAEIVLINSWLPVQQIVYHMLRVFMKSEQLTESANNSGVGTLSNYHIKTLMLWACELKPKSWWTDDLNLIRICVELLHTLAVWLTETRCPHYFINNCNLVDESFATKMITSRLSLIGKNWLSAWFVNNYIKNSVQICPMSVSRLFDLELTRTNLQKAVSVVVHWRRNMIKVDLWNAFYSAEFSIAHLVSIHCLNARACVFWMTELSKIDSRLSMYFICVAFLHVALKIRKCGLIEKMMKALEVTTRHLIDASNYCNERTFSFLNRVLILACGCRTQTVVSTDYNTAELVELLQQSAVELLTTFRHLEERDFGSVATIVTTDFEALYAYKRGDYQRCLQLSIQNINTLLSAKRWHSIPTAFPEFIQLMDDDVVSLTALTLLVNPKCTEDSCYFTITQLTLSLYLMTQCHLKLRNSLTSLALTLDGIKVAQRTHQVHWTLDQLTLKMIERKLLTYIATLNNLSSEHCK